MVAGAAPEGTIAGLEQPYLGCREAEIAGQRGGHNIEQLGLEELLVHLVDGLVQQLQAAGALLRFFEQMDIPQRDGQLPVNASGGLKAKGHPLGATGVSMHVMAALQLMGEAGDMQLPKADLAGVFNMGGAAVTNYVSILERAK